MRMLRGRQRRTKMVNHDIAKSVILNFEDSYLDTCKILQRVKLFVK